MQRRRPGQAAPSKELKNFTNRDGQLSEFRHRLDAPAGSPLPVWMFYGVGGIGKTWLLRRLSEALGDPPVVPSARLELDPTSGGAPYHQDSGFALAEIRRQLGVECPRFDLTYALLRFKQGAGDEPHLKLGGAAHTAWELVIEVAKEVAKFPGAGLVVWLGAKGSKFASAQFKNFAMGKWLAAKAGNEDYINLLRYNCQFAEYLYRLERILIRLVEAGCGMSLEHSWGCGWQRLNQPGVERFAQAKKPQELPDDPGPPHQNSWTGTNG